MSILVGPTIRITDILCLSLNLAAASRIYLLEPQWNPYVEYQAMSRALRLGQMKRVTIIRYLVTGTVEEVRNIQALFLAGYET